MKIKKVKLLEALTKIRPGLSDKAIIEQTDHFIFDKDFIRSYNDEIAVSFPFKSGFSAAIKADEFYRLISEIEGEEVDLSSREGFIDISAGKVRGQIVAGSEIKCPNVKVEAKRWFELPKKFADAVSFCSLSAGRGMSTSTIVLSCLWIKDDCIYSSDSYRATKYKMDGQMPELLFLASAAKELPKYSPTHYAVEGEAWIHFKNDEGTIFSVRVVDGQYMEEIQSVFEVKGDSIGIPEGLKGAINKAKIFAQETTENISMVEIKVDKKGKLTCRGEGVLGWVEQEFQVEYKKKDFVVRASSDLLGEILSHVKEMKISEDKLYFKGEDFEHVVSLV